ncbi:hypothetical protein D3C72_877070 [compost metagenome]
MVDLQQRFRAFRFNRVGNFCQPGDFLIVIDTDSARESQAQIVNKAAFNDDGTDAAGARTVVFHQLAGHRAVVITGAGGHRRHQQTVFEFRTIR